MSWIHTIRESEAQPVNGAEWALVNRHNPVFHYTVLLYCEINILTTITNIKTKFMLGKLKTQKRTLFCFCGHNNYE